MPRKLLLDIWDQNQSSCCGAYCHTFIEVAQILFEDITLVLITQCMDSYHPFSHQVQRVPTSEHCDRGGPSPSTLHSVSRAVLVIVRPRVPVPTQPLISCEALGPSLSASESLFAYL